jgi:hypothetical protein
MKQLNPSTNSPSTSFRTLYQKKIGSVLYAAIQTRPDIAFAAFRLSRFNYCCDEIHMAILDDLIRYLWSTRGYAIRYGNNTGPDARAFIYHSDASFTDDAIDRKSFQGYTMMLFGGLVNWRANRQPTVTTSSTEAELLALSQAGREAIYLARLFAALKLKLNESLQLRCDNTQTIRLVRDERAKLNTNLRHVDIHNHWLRQEVLLHHIAIVWESTHRMVADGLTKPLTPAKHTNFVKLLGLGDILETLQTGEAAESRHLRVLDKLQQLKNEGPTEATEATEGYAGLEIDRTSRFGRRRFDPQIFEFGNPFWIRSRDRSIRPWPT